MDLRSLKTDCEGIRVSRHRGHCHTVVGCAILASPFLIIGYADYVLCFYGCLTHLIVDYLAGKIPGRMPLKLKLW